MAIEMYGDMVLIPLDEKEVKALVVVDIIMIEVLIDEEADVGLVQGVGDLTHIVLIGIGMVGSIVKVRRSVENLDIIDVKEVFHRETPIQSVVMVQSEIHLNKRRTSQSERTITLPHVKMQKSKPMKPTVARS